MRALLSCVLFAFLVCGCSVRSKYMIEPAAPVAVVAPPDAALVVFIRPKSDGSGRVTTILDERGVFLGDSVPRTQFAVAVTPGAHQFMAWDEVTAPILADLLPGRVYYVEVRPHVNTIDPRVELLALTPRSNKWQPLSAWLMESKQLVPDAAAGQAYLNARGAGVEKRLQGARQIASELDEKDRQLQTLRPEDGVISAVPRTLAKTQP